MRRLFLTNVSVSWKLVLFFFMRYAIKHVALREIPAAQWTSTPPRESPSSISLYVASKQWLMFYDGISKRLY